MKELSEKDREVLRILDSYPQGAFLWQVQKFAHISSKQYTYYYLKKLMRKGYAYKESNLYFSIKKQPIQNPRSVSESFTKTSNQAMRIHSLALSFPLRNHLAPDEPAKLGISSFKLSSLRNQKSIYFKEDLQIMLTPSSLIIYTEQLSIPLTASPAAEITKITMKAYMIALKIEDRHKLSLMRIDGNTLMANIMLNHNALTNSEVAKIVLESKEKFEVYDALNIKRVIVDFSHGIPEWEAVSAKYGIQDLTKLKNLTLDVITDKWDYRTEQKKLSEVADITSIQTDEIVKIKKIMLKHHKDLEFISNLLQNQSTNGEPPSRGEPNTRWN